MGHLDWDLKVATEWISTKLIYYEMVSMLPVNAIKVYKNKYLDKELIKVDCFLANAS